MQSRITISFSLYLLNDFLIVFMVFYFCFHETNSVGIAAVLVHFCNFFLVITLSTLLAAKERSKIVASLEIEDFIY